ncbi:beta-galactosidase [Pedobacter sp. HMWF019]|uniref:glycoside hydrolase family 35 protein n=1 Tax=Pedobacter sp. HMWF019 TaxID=2056856 RepID=UPI000D34F64F|nr:beta-galactosidase family protein [Pedobacter sp. HMWF019]PTT00953.1 beta-galactosidase [Pedobacter sp. HMWF019]
MKQIRIALAAIVLFYADISLGYAQQARHTFTLGDSTFLLDGKPLQMISGEMHCTRIPRAYWRERMKAAKAMGLNTIGTYVFWNVHEPVQGQYDFSGNNDIAEFVRIAKEEGLWVVMRPSPYVCAEWEFGGYPWWLLKDKHMKVRSKDPGFLNAYRKYIFKLAEQLAPLQITKGGNIIMVQIENEYGSYSNDKEYLDINRKLFREAGFDALLFTCDGAGQMPDGYLPGYLPAVNGLDNPAEVKALINKYHGGKGPYYIAEWYPGWFDSWGTKTHRTVPAETAAHKLDQVLAAGISINMYMFHGGTTRGFMNGANFDSKQPYLPQTSSYDYDAPLDEAGNPTLKFNLFRKIIAKHLPDGTELPPVPQKHKTIAIPSISLSSYHAVLQNLGEPVQQEHPLSFEELNQAYGFVLYRTILGTQRSGNLKIRELRDYGIVYVNGKQIGVLDRRLQQDSVHLSDLPPHAVLDILVENNGRINYGPYLTDNRHGITEKVSLDGRELKGWKMYKLPYATMKGLRYSKKMVQDGPVVARGVFTLNETGDTYLDLRSFGKGFVYLNGHHLGKYWEIGPTQTIYVPACWLKKGTNEIQVFDLLKNNHNKISTLNEPLLFQP